MYSWPAQLMTMISGNEGDRGLVLIGKQLKSIAMESACPRASKMGPLAYRSAVEVEERTGGG
jgi:hypothetical protein